MKIECTTQVVETGDGVLELVTNQKIGDRITEFYRGVLNTQEQAVKDAMIKLGWTPPGVNQRMVRPGDTWLYLKNHRLGFKKAAWLMTVSAVDVEKGNVYFEDGGWNDLDDMLTDRDWTLIGRKYQPGDEDDYLKGL